MAAGILEWKSATNFYSTTTFRTQLQVFPDPKGRKTQLKRNDIYNVCSPPPPPPILQIINGFVAIDLPSYAVHTLNMLRNSHTFCFRQIETTVDSVLHILILSPRNRAMEPAAIIYNTSVHL